ncbi:MAG: carboxypeptidase-like regulatory domain-containing protein [Planctomycetota bacterium]|nr:carboxypeptidase-like regulatory domain-containing protein [Planctomycetota bacterium]
MNARLAGLVLGTLVLAPFTPAQRGIVAGRALAADGQPVRDLTVSDLRTGQLAQVESGGAFRVEVDDLSTARLRIAARGRATAEVRVVGRTGLGSIVLPRGATVSGTVVDTRGRRVASLPVRVVDALADLPFFPTLDDPPVVFVARAETRGDGSFVVAGALPTAGRLVVTQPGGGETVFEPVEAGVPVEMRVPAVRPGVMRAIDQNGQGQAGVQVFVVDAEGRRTAVGTTDAHGVLLGQLPEGPGLSAVGELVVGAVRVGTQTVALPAAGTALDVVLRLSEPDLVTTEVRGPVSEFEARVWFGTEPAGGAPFTSGDVVRAADQGVLRLPPAPRGTPFVVWARAPGRARTQVRGIVGSEPHVAFGMERGASVRGRVVDASSGDPIAGVEVLWARPDLVGRARDLPAESVSDGDGEFALEGVPAGPGYVVARPAGGGGVATASIAVRAGERVDRLALRVDRGRSARGRVRGAPPDALLEFVGANGWRSDVAIGEDGMFACSQVPFGKAQLRLVVPSPVRLGAPRLLELGSLQDDGVAAEQVAVDVGEVARSLRGRVDFGERSVSRDRIAVFVEPIEPAGPGTLRHTLWFEGARGWIDRNGAFDLLATCAPSMVCVVDVVTGVVLERIDRVDIEADEEFLDLGVIRVDARRVTVEIDRAPSPSVRRVDVDLGSLYPGGIGRMAISSPITELWDRGSGLALADGRDAVELLLPAVEVEVRARSDRFGTPADNILARRRGTPEDGAVWKLRAAR